MQTIEQKEASRLRRNANNRRWAKANRDKKNIYARKWTAKNRERVRSYHDEYYREHYVIYLLAGTKKRAQRLGIPFSLNAVDLVIPTHCPVLGIELSIRRGPFNPGSPSIDKVIPELGYIPSNVRIISMRANILKRDATVDELERVAAYARTETDRVRKGFS